MNNPMPKGWGISPAPVWGECFGHCVEKGYWRMHLGKLKELSDEELVQFSVPDDESAVDGEDGVPTVEATFAMEGYNDNDIIMMSLQGARQTVIQLGAGTRHYNEIASMLEKAIAYMDYYIVRGAGK